TPNKHDLAPATRVSVVLFLSELCVNGNVMYGAIKQAVENFRLSRGSMDKIWRVRSNTDALLAPKRTPPERGRARTCEEVAELALGVPLCQRQTQDALAQATGISRPTLQRYLEDKVIRRAISTIKPTLISMHKLKRI
ncbi:hypothetical protein BBJ28_00020475, partial [Nothophytophthora sp. Chile5]